MAFCALFALGCKPKSFFEAAAPIQSTGWAYPDTLAFTFEVTDTSKRYRMDLKISWEEGYKDQNLYLKLGTKFPGGKKYLQVVRSYDLYDSEGKPIGKQSGKSFSGLFPLQEVTKFAEVGTYEFTVAQHMRTDSLVGIKEIGLVLKQNE
jgi:gliding motility-associated lipoprotein GldH